MPRKFVFFLFFFVISFNAFSEFNPKEFLFLDGERKMLGVKKTTEQLRLAGQRSTRYSFFDEEGFLLRTIDFDRGRRNSAERRYEYSISDTLLVVRQTGYRNGVQESQIIHNFFYNDLKQIQRIETFIYSGGTNRQTGVSRNFIFKEGKLLSYETHTYSFDNAVFLYRFAHTNEGNRQIIQRQHFELTYLSSDTLITTFIYVDGALTDKVIRNSNPRNAFVGGMVFWSREKPNKSHIRYTRFDRRGNWTRSYFITERGRVFRSQRRIEYW